MGANNRTRISSSSKGTRTTGRQAPPAARAAPRRAARDDDDDDDHDFGDDGDDDDDAGSRSSGLDETEVEVREDDDDDDDDDDQGGEGGRPGRRARRRERYEEMARGRDEDRQTIQQLQQQLQQLQGGMQMFAQMRGQTPGQQGQQPPDKDAEYAKKLEAVRDRQDALAREYQALDPKKMTPDLHRDYQKKAAALEDEADAIKIERYTTKMGLRPVDPRQQQRESARAALIARHPELTSTPKLGAMADAQFNLMVARGQPNSMTTYDKAIQECKRELGIGEFAAGAKPGQRVNKGNYAGVSRGGSAGRSDAPPKFKMSDKHKQMAEALFPKLPAARAHQKWANTVGKRIIANEGRRSA